MTKPIGENATWLHARAARPVVVALDALRYAVDRLLKRCHIARPILDEVDGKIAHQAMMHLWQEALALTGDAHLGLHLAEAVPLMPLVSTPLCLALQPHLAGSPSRMDDPQCRPFVFLCDL